MEIELSHVFTTPIEEMWSVVLDPERVAKCVPGIQSVDVISDTEYHARIKVKIAFISANFSIRTVITEMNAPHSLQAEASGQDNSIGSSVKAVVGMNLTTVGEGQTELRVKSTATVLGRLGTLGLNPMRTKAERMWGQFCASLEGLLAGAEPGSDAGPVRQTEPATPAFVESGADNGAQSVSHVEPGSQRRNGIFSWFRSGDRTNGFRVEFDRDGTRVVIACPPSNADQCLAWLDRQLGPQGSK